jgi:hypothetical protein
VNGVSESGHTGKSLLLFNNLKVKKMKKFVWLSMALMNLVVGSLWARENKTEEIFKTYRFGLFVGPCINTLKPTASSSEDYAVRQGRARVGFTFGINVDYNVNERYAVYSGLGMDWRGGNIGVMHDSTTLSNEYLRNADVTYKKMQYLTIPFGLKMKALQIKSTKLIAQTGIDFGILLSQKGDYTLRLSDNTLVTKTNEKLRGSATVVPVNMGWCIGIGGEYPLNDKNSISTTLLYRNGFIDATTPKSNDLTKKFSDGNIRSNTVILRIGYFF